MANTSVPLSDGYIPFTYQGETFQTYCKVFGHLQGRTSNPLVVLHGGPGLTHDYTLSLSDLATSSIPVILYDQLGNGKSTHLKDKPEKFWTIDLFIDELINLLRHFGIEDSFDILGHSWGGILGLEFEVRRQPVGLKHLVLTNALASVGLYREAQSKLLETFPEWVREGMAAGIKDTRKYPALKEFYAKHVCNVSPWPEEVTDSFDQVYTEKGDATVMSAPVVRGWSIIDRLHLVRVPSLVINGPDDVSQDLAVAPLVWGINRTKWVRQEGTSHMPFWEKREDYMDVVRSFLK